MAWYEVFLFLLVALTAFTKQRCLVDAATASFMPPNAASYCSCPGDQVTFNCTVVDTDRNRLTRWQIGGSPTTCILAHSDNASVSVCGPEFVFKAQFEDAVGNCFFSSLSVVATPELDGTTIQCEGPLVGEEVGNTTLHIRVAPVKPVLNPLMVSSIMPQGSDVTVELIGTLENADEDCPQDLMLNGLDGQLNTFEGADFHFLGTGVIGESYDITVSVGSCGQVNESDPLSLNLIVPGAPSTCTAIPVYDHSTNQLTHVHLSWTHVNDTIRIAPGLEVQATKYWISSSDKLINFPVPLSVCTDGVCTETYSSIYPLCGEFSVAIAAENILGLGSPCNTTTPVVTTNQDVRVVVNTSSERVECRFTAGCTACSSCSIRYSTSADLADAMEDSSSVCEDGAVIIQLSAGLSDKDYYYEVTAVSGASTIILSGSVVMTTESVNAESSSASDSVSTTAVAGIAVAVFVVAFIAGCVVGGLLFYCIFRQRIVTFKPTSPAAPPDTHRSQYENIHELQSVPAEYELVTPERKEIAVGENEAYRAPPTARPVGRIELRENEAYGPLTPAL